MRILRKVLLNRKESFPIRSDTAGSSRQSLSLSVARQMVLRASGTRLARTAAERRPARASTAAACRAYRCQLTAEPFAVRCPANGAACQWHAFSTDRSGAKTCSCKHGSRLPGVSHKKRAAAFGFAAAPCWGFFCYILYHYSGFLS